MKIKLDENMPVGLAGLLAADGHDVDTVADEGLAGCRDDRVWAAAQVSQRLLITQDLDFSDLRRFAPGTHAGLLLVRLREPGRRALTQHVRRVFRAEKPAGWEGCVVVLTERKVRILRP